MNCEKARDLLLTDYWDDCIDPALKQELEAHLAACGGCRDYCQAASRAAMSAASALSREDIPAGLQEKVMSRVAGMDVSQAFGVADRFLDGLERMRDALFVPRPRWALVPVAMALVIGVFALKAVFFSPGSGPAVSQGSQSIEQVSYAVSGIEYGTSLSSEGYGTDIEEFFL